MATTQEFRRGGSVTLDMSATPEQVYDLVSDVTRIGEWSPECHSAEWRHGATGPEVGARFRGHNTWGWNRWSRECEVVEADPGRSFSWRTIPGRGASADSSTWRFDLEAIDGGCRVTQCYEMTKMPQRWFQPVIRRFMSHHLDNRPHMTMTLEALRSTAESGVDGVDSGEPSATGR